MRTIILATHHRLAQGMADTLQFLTAYANVAVLTAYIDDQDIEIQIKELMAQAKGEEIFIFTDMLGGSVTQKFVPYMNAHTHLICGMNLPIVLSIALGHEEPYETMELHTLIQEAREALLYVNTHQIQSLDEDE